MPLFRNLGRLPPENRGGVITLGNFDGLHKGHQAVLRSAREKAIELNTGLGVLTTEPHPRNFFEPELPSFRLTPLRSKLHLLQEFGADNIYLLRFDARYAAQLAQDFVLDILIGQLQVRHVVVGYNYRFGNNRGGGLDVLRWMGEMEGFGVTAVAPYTEGGERYSSTRIRELLMQGDVVEANRMLGRAWTVEGRVRAGDRRGRQLGFPTANLSLQQYIKPALGVYAVQVEILEAPGQMFGAVANVGRRPTFGKHEVLAEVHLFDFSGDLYGKHLRVHFATFLRAERKFAGVEQLKSQIEIDCTEAAQILAAANHTC